MQVCATDVAMAVEQVVAVHALPALAEEDVHEATGVGPVVTGVGQVVVVQPFEEVGPLALQLAAPAGPVLITGQAVVVQPFPDVGDTGVQDETATSVLLVVQVVVV